jgi:hypothetical protein
MKKGSTKKASKRRAGKWPSKASLKEIPETSDANTVTFGRGPAAREKALEFMRGRGRPKKGTTPEGTATKSLRLPVKVWAEIERVAEKRGVSVHAAMREAIAKWLAA